MDLTNLILECSETESYKLDNFEEAETRTEFAQMLSELKTINSDLPFIESMIPIYRNDELQEAYIEIDMLQKFMSSNNLSLEEAVCRLEEYCGMSRDYLYFVALDEDATREVLKEARCGKKGCKSKANTKIKSMKDTLKDIVDSNKAGLTRKINVVKKKCKRKKK